MISEKNVTAEVSTQISVKTIKATKANSRLTHHVQLVLHTKIAQSLFDGSWGYQKMGLMQFSKVVQSLWQSSKNDDPYADWYLMKTQEQMLALREQLNKTEKHCQEKLAKLRGVEVEIFINPTPTKLPLHFYTPLCYMAAYLLADLDYVTRLVYTLKHLGFILEKDLSPILFIGKLHDLFALPRKWKYTEVRRQDIRENNQKAQYAKSLMGELPLTILDKKIHF